MTRREMRTIEAGWAEDDQRLARHVLSPEATRHELFAATGHVWPMLRHGAYGALAERFPDDEEVARVLYRGALDPYNRQPRLFGSTHNGHVCVALLLRMTAPVAKLLAKQLILAWPEEDRHYLADALWANGVGPRPEVPPGQDLREVIKERGLRDP